MATPFCVLELVVRREAPHHELVDGKGVIALEYKTLQKLHDLHRLDF
jgi:hypothetical protein